MKILVVASTFPSSDNDPVPAFVKDQIIAFKKVDPSLSFSVLAPHDKRSDTQSFVSHDAYDEYRFHYFWPHKAEKLAGRGIMPALKANPLNYFLIPFLFAGEFFALLRLARKLRPDALYAHWFTPQAINARFVGALTKTPFVFTTHASDVDVWHKIPVVGPEIVRSNTRKSRAFTAVSPRSMAKLAKFFDDAEWKHLESRSRIIPMGVDLPEISPASNYKSDTPTILFVGRLAEKKGVQYLLPAFAKIRHKFPTAQLIVAGDGPMKTQLENQTHDLQLGDSVSFPGYVSGAAKSDAIKSTSVYVVPSIITRQGDAEGLPVSLMEGLAYGKICIATNESGADNILSDGVDGFLVPQQDVEALADSLRSALSLDETKRQAMSQAAQKTAQQFAWPDIARQHLEFLFGAKK